MSVPVEIELSRVRELTQRGHYADALAAVDALALEAADHREVLFLRAVNLRYLKRIAPALEILQRLEQRDAQFGRLYQERGHCHAARGEWHFAIDAFASAVRVNPALLNSWRMLEQLYRAQGDLEKSTAASEQSAQLRRQPPDVVRAASSLSDGEFGLAEELLRNFLANDVNHVEAMRLLARVLMQRGALLESERLLQAVLERKPQCWAARADCVRVLLRAQRFASARDHAEVLLGAEPQNTHYLALRAMAYSGLGDHAVAIESYERILTTAPAPEIHLLLGHSFRAIGRPWDAIESYHAAAAAKPSFGDAYWSLANLKVYRFSSDEVARMKEAVSTHTTESEDRYHLCFALGRELENRGDYAEAWGRYERGNALKHAIGGYRPKAVEAETQGQVEVCTAKFFAARAGTGTRAADPIFIVGLPRSGSTLIEQILASHSLVEATHELALVPRFVQELQDSDEQGAAPRYPRVLMGLSPEQLLRLGERYLSEASVYRRGEVNALGRQPFFIDKMPNNFRHVGLIHLMLPNAKIIDVRREPMACCVSNLKQLFASGQDFSYSVGDVARYYRNYLTSMRHWDEVLPGRVLRVPYEHVVADLEGAVRRILEYCQLGFEPACLEFHRTRRSVHTASSEQVRRPIYREGVTQWRHFERWLGPLKNALGDALVRYQD